MATMDESHAGARFTPKSGGPRILSVAVPVFALAVLIITGGQRVPKPSARAAETSGPNILIIVTDDQRQGLNVMPKTIKWLGDGGTEYTNAFVTTPLCCPSRATIFTGQYAHNHGVKIDDKGGVLDQATTMQYYLHQAGYKTG